RRVFVAASLVVESCGGNLRAIRLRGTIEKVIGECNTVGKTVVKSVDGEENVRARWHQITAANQVIQRVSPGQRSCYRSGLGCNAELYASDYARIACRKH